MSTNESQPWRSQFLDDTEESSLPERGRALGALIVAGAIVVAVVKCLANPNDPIPVTFCAICGLVALVGVAVSVISTQWRSTGNLSKAFLNLKSIVAVLVLLAAGGGTAFHYLLNAKLVVNEALKTFTCIEDHIDFMQKQTDPRVRILAYQALVEKYKPEEIENGYVAADLRAIEKADYTGKGLFLATTKPIDDTHANVVIVNATEETLVFSCDGPTPIHITIPPRARDSFKLLPGDYKTAVAKQADYNSEPVAATKHVVKGVNYKGIISMSQSGYLTHGDLAHHR